MWPLYLGERSVVRYGITTHGGDWTSGMSMVCRITQDDVQW